MNLDLLPEAVWQAARLASGQDVPEATDEARLLADTALEVADRQAMDDLTEHIDAGYRPSSRFGVRVSDAGRCGRAVWYRELPPDGYTPAATSKRAAILGQVIGNAIDEARAVRYPWRKYQMEIPIPGLDKRGRIDEYDPVLGEVTDDKTAGDRKWEIYGEDVPEDAWAQVLVYALALEELGYPVRTLRVIAINRSNGAEEHFRRDYDPAAAYDALADLLALATMLDLGVTPPREGNGPGVFPCSWCEARIHCWNVASAEQAGRSPESYTILGAEPSDPTIGWAARNLAATRKAATTAKNAKEYAETLLQGIKPGEYDGMVVGVGRRDMPDYKAGFNRLLSLYALPDEHRPAIEKVEQPPLRPDRWITAKPIRAAERQPAKSRRKAGKSGEPK